MDATIQRQYRDFRENGFVVVENALNETELTQSRSAFQTAQTATEPAWREMVRSGVFKGGYGNGPSAHSMENPYHYDTVILDIADNPRITPLLREVIGPGLQVTELFAHCHHAGTPSHTGWHRDWPPYRHPKYVLKAKVFYFLDDITEDMGCFSVVPGTHKQDDAPSRSEYVGDTLEDRPGMIKITGAAGSCVIWDVTIWHSATANTSTHDRRMLLYGYHPYFVKNWESTTPPEVVVNWANTPERRELMGIHAVQGRASWDRHDVPYLPVHEEIARTKKF
jgi:ectoine hydroxylase